MNGERSQDDDQERERPEPTCKGMADIPDEPNEEDSSSDERTR
jgi:hypothetical protein